MDGSNQLIEINPQIIYAPISVAIIYQNFKTNKIENSIYPYIDVIRVTDEQGSTDVQNNESSVQFYGTILDGEEIKCNEQSVKSTVNNLMLKYETDALFKIIYKINTGKIDVPSVIFLDGPLIDPPIGGSDDMIKLRCDAFKQLKEKGVCIVGVTKRIFHRHYLDHLKNSILVPNPDDSKKAEVKDVIKFLDCVSGDADLINSIFNNLTGIEKPIFSKLYKMSKLDLREDPRRRNATTEYEKYREKGVDFDCCFFMNTWNPIKLDLLLPGKPAETPALYDQVLDCVAKLTYPGLSVPFPVFLAHNYANIKNDMAELLKRMILGGVTSKMPDFVLTNIIQNYYNSI